MASFGVTTTTTTRVTTVRLQGREKGSGIIRISRVEAGPGEERKEVGVGEGRGSVVNIGFRRVGGGRWQTA